MFIPQSGLATPRGSDEEARGPGPGSQPLAAALQEVRRTSDQVFVWGSAKDLGTGRHDAGLVCSSTDGAARDAANTSSLVGRCEAPASR